jgi:hypothetical protein
MMAARATRTLFFVSALVWLGVGILAVSGSPAFGPVRPETLRLLGAAMLAAAGVLAFLAWRVFTGSRLIDGFAVTVAVVNVALTLTDEVGVYDLAYLVLSMALLGSLLVTLVTSRRRAADQGREPELRRPA